MVWRSILLGCSLLMGMTACHSGAGSQRSVVTWNNTGVVHSRAGEYRVALKAYQQIPFNRVSALIRYNRGLALLKLRRYAAAERELKSAVAARPRFAAAWNNLGLTLYGQRRYRDAVVALRRAVALSPTNHRAWNNLAVAQIRLGKVADAVQSIRTSVAVKPRYRVARRNLHRILSRQLHDDNRGAR